MAIFLFGKTLEAVGRSLVVEDRAAIGNQGVFAESPGCAPERLK